MEKRAAYFAWLARHTLDRLGLRDWEFQFDCAQARCGACWYGRMRITLSWFYATNPAVPDEAVVDTLLHECAHALAGWRAGHGPEWRRVAHRIGCAGNVRAAHPTGAPPRVHAGCSCGATSVWRYRRSRRLAASRCARCGSRLRVVRLPSVARVDR